MQVSILRVCDLIVIALHSQSLVSIAAAPAVAGLVPTQLMPNWHELESSSSVAFYCLLSSRGILATYSTLRR
jgi:hypothetical protein